MAKAKAICTCKTCGAQFVKETMKSSRQEADSWEEWALSAYTECPDCYGERMRKEAESQPLTLAIRLNPYTKQIVCVFTGNTLPMKDQLKAVGYRWTEEPVSGIFGVLKTSSRKAWAKTIDVVDIDKAAEEAKAIGAEVKIEINREDIIACEQMAQATAAKASKAAAEAEAKEERIQAEIEKIEKPVKPSCYPTGKWNHKIYGLSVYVDGVRIAITKQEAKEIEAYDAAIAEYKAKVEQIRNS